MNLGLTLVLINISFLIDVFQILQREGLLFKYIFSLFSFSTVPCLQNHQEKQDFRPEKGRFCSPIKLPLAEEGKLVINWFYLENKLS